MKRKIAVLLFVIISLSAHAQFGIKAGVGLSRPTEFYYNPRISIHFGGLYNYQLSERWFLQPELLFKTMGGDIKTYGYFNKSGVVKMCAIEVPVKFSFRPSIGERMKFMLNMGAYCRYAVSGKYEFSELTMITEERWEMADFDKSPFDDYKRFDAGFNIGVGLKMSNYMITITRQLGVNNIEKINSGVLHNEINMSLAYIF